MSAFTRIRVTFSTNWTTVSVGWKGLGEYSPWPDRLGDFPPLLSVNEVATYAEERFATSCAATQEQIVRLLSLDLTTEGREVVEGILQNLSKLDGGDLALEHRKWRLVLLEELLETLPDDALNGLVALSEFWQSFGFPADIPNNVQGRRNNIAPEEYYQDENFCKAIACHQAWLQEEKESIKNKEEKRKEKGTA